MGLTTIDWVIMAVYFPFVLGIGAALKRYMKTSTDFFLAGRSIPAWIFDSGIIVSALVVLTYIYLGGLTSAIYNEVLQFFLIVAGFIPLVWLGLKNVGGWSGLKASLGPSYVHSWVGMGSPHTNRLGVEWFGLTMGLGFVLSFGYWCTDFLVVQRAMAADFMASARRTPLIAAVPKMLFPFLVILPGLIAIALPTQPPPVMNGPQGSAIAAPAGRGLIPANLDSTTRQPVLDNSGHLPLHFVFASPNCL